MSLPMVTFISGISGVAIVMLLLLATTKLSSKLAIFIEKRNEEASKNS
ncbi:MAG: oxaloacetate decarboxylase subunit gamma [Syntrophomonadales bacterium]